MLHHSTLPFGLASYLTRESTAGAGTRGIGRPSVINAPSVIERVRSFPSAATPLCRFSDFYAYSMMMAEHMSGPSIMYQARLQNGKV